MTGTYANDVRIVRFAARKHEELVTRLLEKLGEYQQSVDEYATSLGANWGWRYLNYADRRTQDAIPTMGEEAIAKLKAVSAKYDPRGVFQQLRKSGFKIPT